VDWSLRIFYAVLAVFAVVFIVFAVVSYDPGDLFPTGLAAFGALILVIGAALSFRLARRAR
jgi:ATP/ADP translocase